jgi:hypothetical protein
MSVTVTNSTISDVNTLIELTSDAATSTTIDEAEVFTITPTQAKQCMTIIIGNGTGHGALTAAFSAGDMWGAKAISSLSVGAGEEQMIKIDSFKALQNDGTIDLTLTPASGKRLLTDHAAYVKVVEDLF